MKLDKKEQPAAERPDEFPARTPYLAWINKVAEKWRRVCQSDEGMHHDARNRIHARILVALLRSRGADGAQALKASLSSVTAWDDAEADRLPDAQRRRVVAVFSEDQRQEVLALAQSKILARNRILEALGMTDLPIGTAHDLGLRQLPRVGAIMAVHRIVPHAPDRPGVTGRRPLTEDEHTRRARAMDDVAAEMVG